MVGAYLRGEAALPLVASLTIVFSFLWYLAGVVHARALRNIGATLVGFMWVGFLGSYAGLLLDPDVFPNRHGVAFLLGALIAAVSYDVGGFAVGSRLGRRPLAPLISPNKTWEGLIGGMVACLVLSAAVVSQIHPWSFHDAVALGLVAAVVAPLGDLCQSLVKRDLGIKDMGTLLPGHGGLLDRVDAILFVLPATYYLVRVLGLG
jgi:phosphatidate cytidylyltransferase